MVPSFLIVVGVSSGTFYASNGSIISQAYFRNTSSVLQSCLKRSFKAEVYSCPTCRKDLGTDYKLEVNDTLRGVLNQLFPGYENGRWLALCLRLSHERIPTCGVQFTSVSSGLQALCSNSAPFSSAFVHVLCKWLCFLSFFIFFHQLFFGSVSVYWKSTGFSFSFSLVCVLIVIEFFCCAVHLILTSLCDSGPGASSPWERRDAIESPHD